ncbi:MAG: hypothetical protein E7615_02550 [Ruminococcaceae bacterium]|nr:hypothetical protein [Oscillospiraceae bacterium]
MIMGVKHNGETGYYYCHTRYYNPEICRWINPDSLLSTGQGILGNNMYAYCGNNPVNLKDGSVFAASIGGSMNNAAGINNEVGDWYYITLGYLQYSF